jgi:probable DNA metabolism protein
MRSGPLTPPPLRSANHSPKGEQVANANARSLLPSGEKVAAKRPDEGGGGHRESSASQYIVTLASPTDFTGWREAARALVLNQIPPDAILWSVAGITDASDLFAAGPESTPLPAIPPGAELRVPKRFIDLAEAVICLSDPIRFGFLYRILWRLQRDPHLLSVATDADVRKLEEMERSVRRDIHKMRAFVRFRRIGEGDAEHYVAWFEPEHFIVERNAPLFVRRFTGMRWTILTPHASADWDGARLAIGPGATKADAPSADAEEGLWKTYFSSIFNPARLKVKAMTAEMPKKYWRNLPEASLIPDMIASAGNAAREMIERMPTMPAPHHDKVQDRHWRNREVEDAGDGAGATTITGLRAAAEGCRRCPLWRDATQTVFGEGPDNASVVFVGEQPGDHEDIAGKPFVGPAGKLFDAVIDEAGIDRLKTYVTNAVKHFKFEPRGKRRIHSKPNAGEVQACRWWIDHELKLIKPDLVVALGATAALSLLGKAIPITKMRGQTVTREDGLRVFLTVHPSYLLRIPDPRAKAEEHARFADDMRAVKGMMR